MSKVRFIYRDISRLLLNGGEGKNFSVYLAFPLLIVGIRIGTQDMTGLENTMRRLDTRGIIQPFTFLIISDAFKEIRAGETIEILWGDPDSLPDLLKILPEASYNLVSTEAIEGKDSGMRIHLKKIAKHQGGRGCNHYCESENIKS